jgi:hypothetical protein
LQSQLQQKPIRIQKLNRRYPIIIITFRDYQTARSCLKLKEIGTECLEATKGVGVEDDGTTANDSGRDGGASESSSLLVLGESVGAIEAIRMVSNWTASGSKMRRYILLVDGTGHTHLAMAANSLGAIVPNWVLVGNGDLEDVGLQWFVSKTDSK